jgi:hypothetical protein
MGRLCYLMQYRAVSINFSQLTVPVQGRYGALFAIMVQILLHSGAIAIQALSKPRPDSYRDYPRLQSWLWAPAQCRGTICLEAKNLSRCRIYITG